MAAPAPTTTAVAATVIATPVVPAAPCMASCRVGLWVLPLGWEACLSQGERAEWRLGEVRGDVQRSREPQATPANYLSAPPYPGAADTQQAPHECCAC